MGGTPRPHEGLGLRLYGGRDSMEAGLINALWEKASLELA